ncbi:MAG: biopolymer transporter ExbD [Gammaproteobacteria bacterium]|nr:biopolymer transporter ExbD [Gammaproteobacteria bacterium]
MKLQPRRLPEEPNVNLISLVDVVLLLVIFFVLTTSFVRQSQLAVHLPEAADAAPATDANPPALEITVTARGGFFVNGRALVDNRAETLAAAIRRVQPDGELRAVTISADARAAHQDVVTAMDVAGRLGITEVRIATLHARDR